MLNFIMNQGNANWNQNIIYTHKIGKTKCGWRHGALGTHMLLGGVWLLQSLWKLLCIVPWSWTCVKSVVEHVHSYRNSYPCVPEDTYKSIHSTHGPIQPWVNYFIFLYLCFVISKTRTVIPTSLLWRLTYTKALRTVPGHGKFSIN